MFRVAVFTGLLAVAGAPLACGVCVEDKMAAVYDHAVVTRALSQKHHVAFFHLDGPLLAGDATKQALEKIAQSSAADRGSVRVSVPSAALAVAFDPRRTPLAALQKDLERRLAPKKLTLMLLQVVERPVGVNPSVARALRAAGK